MPQLVESVRAPDGGVLSQFEPQVRRRIPLAPAHVKLIRDALWSVVNREGGTAHDPKSPSGPVSIAGKTGTAQVEQHQRDKADDKRGWYAYRSHAWFAGWAPAEAPELAIVVMVEHGGGGGKNAAPIAVEALQQYYSDRREPTLINRSDGAP